MQPYSFTTAYPTPQHEHAAQAIVAFFAQRPGVSAVLLTCSCARGKATPDSCLDIAILVPNLVTAERIALEQAWAEYHAHEPAFQELLRVGAFSHVDLDFHTGRFDPAHHPHGWTSGPDEFELDVGNLLAYSALLWQGDAAYRDLRAAWLPYYPADLRCARLDLVLRYCRNNLAHIPLYVKRKLYFQAFNRLYHALGEFLQALFIARQVYPIAYDKWMREQVVDILGLPELYLHLVHLLEVNNLESDELALKAIELEGLIEQFVTQSEI